MRTTLFLSMRNALNQRRVWEVDSEFGLLSPWDGLVDPTYLFRPRDRTCMKTSNEEFW